MKGPSFSHLPGFSEDERLKHKDKTSLSGRVPEVSV